MIVTMGTAAPTRDVVTPSNGSNHIHTCDIFSDSILITNSVIHDADSPKTCRTLSSSVYVHNMRLFGRYIDVTSRQLPLVSTDRRSCGVRFLEVNELASKPVIQRSPFRIPISLTRLVSEHSSVRLGVDEFYHDVSVQDIITASVIDLLCPYDSLSDAPMTANENTMGRLHTNTNTNTNTNRSLPIPTRSGSGSGSGSGSSAGGFTSSSIGNISGSGGGNGSGNSSGEPGSGSVDIVLTLPSPLSLHAKSLICGSFVQAGRNVLAIHR